VAGSGSDALVAWFWTLSADWFKPSLAVSTDRPGHSVVASRMTNPTRTEAAPPAGDLDAMVDAAAAPLEAVLLTLDRPVSPAKLGEALSLGPQGTDIIERAIEQLNEEYRASGRSFKIERVAGGFRLMTLPEFADIVGAFHKDRASAKLSKAAIETLSVIAYRQPITRADLEAIRGVSCGEVLRTLVDKRLVTIAGRAEELGRPMLYGTTKEFLDNFGLASLKDLPPSSEFGVR